jgi:murein DD-endopeptidase MepM/ murein hydrolase activator NlpD
MFFLLFVFSVAVFTEETVHIVQKGETIFSVARSYGVSVGEVLAFNGMTEADARKVQVGQRLKIPGGAGNWTAPSSGSPSYTEHRVAKSETFYSIARHYGITLQDLLDMNGFLPSYVLKEGERIRVPAAASGVAAVPGTAGSPRSDGEGRGTVTGQGSGRVAAAGGSSGGSARTVDGGIRWPVSAKEVSYLTGKLYGVVVVGERSESVKSLTQGTVVSAGPYRGFGRVAIVQRAGGYLYVYGGCESLSVKEGAKVTAGTELGKLGLDAKSEKPQLFFLVYRSNSPIDPAKAPRA